MYAIRSYYVTDFSYSKSFKKPTRFTIQLNEEQHIELQPIHLQYINHSCSPNVYFNTQKMQLIALREIKKGDEIVYFYPSTEWKMTEEFLCTCKSNNCLKQIKGAAFLPYDIITRYEISDYIQRKSTQAYNNLPFKNLN